ncbi:MAG TPA: PP2C family protein-serine/threonine phosphatase [Vicinamibacteria bacterium]|nr:PP2C family protein-serine/threonine phosphatase [Vicinamibacteria bacterium]
MDSYGAPRLEAKLLYRRLDSLFGALDPELPPRRLMESFLEDAFTTLRGDLRLQAGLAYAEGRDDFSLLKAVGRLEDTPQDGFESALRPVALVLQHGVYIFPDPDHDDAPARHGLTPRRPVAAVVVGRRPKRYVLLFVLADGWVREELDFTLNTIRAALGSRFMEERALGSLEQAAEIQQSLLLEDPPPFPGYDLAARSRPAEEVGGDFFDFALFDDEELIGLSIGDASGHGLPAALLVRDVVTGLRMGLERDLKITHVFTKLNRVIHRSTLSSRFVSVFYGELERNGHLIYVNAGHQPPLLFSGDKVIELSTGGTVIGPLPQVRFHRGVAYLQPGDVMVLCTDGILERRARDGSFFGEERLRDLVRAHRHQPARSLLHAIFEAAETFGAGRAWEDDATVVVVRRTE